MNNEPNTSSETFEARKAAELRRDYAALLSSVDSVLERMRALPKTVETDEEIDLYAIEIKAARELKKRLTGIHESEKAAPLGEGRAVDNVFFGAIDRLERRSNVKSAKPGAVDVCQQRINDCLNRRLEKVRAQQAAEAAEAARKLREVQEQLAAAQAAAAEAEAKAARARKEENIAAHAAEAEKWEAAATASKREFAAAIEAAEDAETALKSKPADVTRVRLESGSLATMKEEPIVQILDATKLDKELLWPFIKEEHILMALKAWAKTKAHKTPMVGAMIKMGNKGEIR